jgi:putative flippase GtrA
VLLPLVRDEEWFFDTEMLVLAERAGLRIYEVPVDWVDDPDSRVDVVRTALADLKGMVRLAGGLFTGAIALDRLHEFGHARARTRTGTVTQLGRFLVVGVVSTLAYVCLYLLLRASLAAQAANAVALFTTAVANTWGNRRFTFAVRGSRHALRHQVRGLAVFAAAWGLTAGSLAALGALGRGAGRLLELIALVVANLTATVLRFVALRGWVFRSASRTDPATVAAGTAARQAAPEVLTTGSSS